MAPLSDDEIRKMAKARAGFKSHFMVYLLVNLLLATIWFVTRGYGMMWMDGHLGSFYYWPIWTHIGWGLGVALHWYFAMGPGQGMQQREEERLRERYGRT